MFGAPFAPFKCFQAIALGHLKAVPEPKSEISGSDLNRAAAALAAFADTEQTEVHETTGATADR